MIPRLRPLGFDVTVIQRRMEPKRVHGREGTKRYPVLYGSNSCHSRVIRNQQNLYPKFLLLP